MDGKDTLDRIQFNEDEAVHKQIRTEDDVENQIVVRPVIDTCRSTGRPPRFNLYTGTVSSPDSNRPGPGLECTLYAASTISPGCDAKQTGSKCLISQRTPFGPEDLHPNEIRARHV